MNEFTKEELITIEYCLDNFIQTIINDEIENKCIDVLIKIQSMIDNYCEHEWHSGGNRPWLHCIKCKSNFNHEPSLY